VTVQDCPTCGGNGEIVETREPYVSELTQNQISFIYLAWIEREKAKWGGEDGPGSQGIGGAGMGSSLPSGSSMPNVSSPTPGSPPVSGNTTQF